MNFKEIQVKNPITSKSIDQLFVEIISCNHSLLLINIGEHNFESIEVIKELKKRLNLEKNILNQFTKIAFLHPPQIKNISEHADRYNFFSDKEEATNWLTKF